MRYFYFTYESIFSDGNKQLGNISITSQYFPDRVYVVSKIKEKLGVECAVTLLNWNEFKNEEDYNFFNIIRDKSNVTES